jgi:hypothetical protein
MKSFLFCKKKFFIYREGASYARLTGTKYAQHVDGLQSVGGWRRATPAGKGGRRVLRYVWVGLICGDALSVWLTMMMRLFAPLALWS